MNTKSIEFVVCHKQTKVVFTHCAYTEDHFTDFIDDDEEKLAKWRAMPLEQRQAIIDKCVEDGCFPFSIGNTSGDEDCNHLTSWDSETVVSQEEDIYTEFNEDYQSFNEYILKAAEEVWKTPEEKLADLEKQRELLRGRAILKSKLEDMKEEYELQVELLKSRHYMTFAK